MSIEKQIHQYLSTMKKYLARLDKTEANEVLKEIESHILDAVDAQETIGEPVEINKILEGFGAPRTLAAQYVDHVLTGTPPPQGFSAIKKMTQGVTKGLWYSMACFGYLIAVILGFIGITKLLFPTQMGLWSSAQGNTIVIAFSDNNFPMSEEILGWWLIPLAIISSLLVWALTRKVLQALKANQT